MSLSGDSTSRSQQHSSLLQPPPTVYTNNNNNNNVKGASSLPPVNRSKKNAPVVAFVGAPVILDDDNTTSAHNNNNTSSSNNYASSVCRPQSPNVGLDNSRGTTTGSTFSLLTSSGVLENNNNNYNNNNTTSSSTNYYYNHYTSTTGGSSSPSHSKRSVSSPFARGGVQTPVLQLDSKLFPFSPITASTSGFSTTTNTHNNSALSPIMYHRMPATPSDVSTGVTTFPSYGGGHSNSSNRNNNNNVSFVSSAGGHSPAGGNNTNTNNNNVSSVSNICSPLYFHRMKSPVPPGASFASSASAQAPPPPPMEAATAPPTHSNTNNNTNNNNNGGGGGAGNNSRKLPIARRTYTAHNAPTFALPLATESSYHHNYNHHHGNNYSCGSSSNNNNNNTVAGSSSNTNIHHSSNNNTSSANLSHSVSERRSRSSDESVSSLLAPFSSLASAPDTLVALPRLPTSTLTLFSEHTENNNKGEDILARSPMRSSLLSSHPLENSVSRSSSNNHPPPLPSQTVGGSSEGNIRAFAVVGEEGEQQPQQEQQGEEEVVENRDTSDIQVSPMTLTASELSPMTTTKSARSWNFSSVIGKQDSDGNTNSKSNNNTINRNRLTRSSVPATARSMPHLSTRSPGPLLRPSSSAPLLETREDALSSNSSSLSPHPPVAVRSGRPIGGTTTHWTSLLTPGGDDRAAAAAVDEAEMNGSGKQKFVPLAAQRTLPDAYNEEDEEASSPLGSKLVKPLQIEDLSAERHLHLESSDEDDGEDGDGAHRTGNNDSEDDDDNNTNFMPLSPQLSSMTNNTTNDYYEDALDSEGYGIHTSTRNSNHPAEEIALLSVVGVTGSVRYNSEHGGSSSFSPEASSYSSSTTSAQQQPSAAAPPANSATKRVNFNFANLAATASSKAPVVVSTVYTQQSRSHFVPPPPPSPTAFQRRRHASQQQHSQQHPAVAGNINHIPTPTTHNSAHGHNVNHHALHITSSGTKGSGNPLEDDAAADVLPRCESPSNPYLSSHGTSVLSSPVAVNVDGHLQAPHEAPTSSSATTPSSSSDVQTCKPRVTAANNSGFYAGGSSTFFPGFSKPLHSAGMGGGDGPAAWGESCCSERIPEHLASLTTNPGKSGMPPGGAHNNNGSVNNNNNNISPSLTPTSQQNNSNSTSLVLKDNHNNNSSNRHRSHNGASNNHSTSGGAATTASGNVKLDAATAQAAAAAAATNTSSSGSNHNSNNSNNSVQLSKSALSPLRKKRAPAVVEWIDHAAQWLFCRTPADAKGADGGSFYYIIRTLVKDGALLHAMEAEKLQCSSPNYYNFNSTTATTSMDDDEAEEEVVGDPYLSMCLLNVPDALTPERRQWLRDQIQHFRKALLDGPFVSLMSLTTAAIISNGTSPTTTANSPTLNAPEDEETPFSSTSHLLSPEACKHIVASGANNTNNNNNNDNSNNMNNARRKCKQHRRAKKELNNGAHSSPNESVGTGSLVVSPHTHGTNGRAQHNSEGATTVVSALSPSSELYHNNNNNNTAASNTNRRHSATLGHSCSTYYSSSHTDTFVGEG